MNCVINSLSTKELNDDLNSLVPVGDDRTKKTLQKCNLSLQS